MRKLLQQQGNLHVKVDSLRKQLDDVQKVLDVDPNNSELRVQETKLLQDFRSASLDEEEFLKQKSKVHWLSVGDKNSKFFHNSVKCKNHRSRIEVIKDSAGVTHEGGDAPLALVHHYQNFLGFAGNTTISPSPDLFFRKLDSSKVEAMIRRVTHEEKLVMFSIDDNKAPGPDGFSSGFFKNAWIIVGKDVCLAVHDFFCTAQLLQVVNHTFLAMVPKVPTPSAINDF
uniref:uncharacterized protein LOC122591582 n=1 Tax=Erigeron canadensis TaxID=72917 RepID=UPI001CB9D18B|nr:uncharacterized protein LOC122591582 [Erigeron canadensis]